MDYSPPLTKSYDLMDYSPPLTKSYDLMDYSPPLTKYTHNSLLLSDQKPHILHTIYPKVNQ